MNNASFNYVRTFRQRHALSANELAFLVGQRSHAAISRIEVEGEIPTLKGAFALQVLFSQQPLRMFPGLYEAVEDSVMQRAKTMIDSLGDKADPRSIAKREFLESLARADGSYDEV